MKTALITGGAQGIGKGIVERLKSDGWRVALFDLDDEAVAEMRADDILASTVDVTDQDAVRNGFDHLKRWLDGAGLDLLVSNAGIADPQNGPIEDLSLADWRKMLDSHVTGAFLTVRESVPLLRQAQGQASILLMSSVRALQSEPDTESYGTSKGALLGMTHSLAVSLGPDIRVNAILPGWIETAEYQKKSERRTPHHTAREKSQHPVGRIGDPKDIAGLVAWLASDEAGFITGQRFIVDGGMSARLIYEEYNE